MDILNEILVWVGVVLLALVFLSISVAAHELGHLLFAKWRGMIVEKFAIGFGPVIWKKDWGGIEWSLRPLPLGGFVSLPQMASMETVEGKTEADKASYPPAKPFDRIIAALGGPLFSFLFGLAVAVFVWMVGKPESEAQTTTVVGYVEPDSPAAMADSPILPGDKILFIDNQPVTRFSGGRDNIIEAIVLSTGPTIQFDIERGSRTEGIELVTTDIKPELDDVFKVRRVGISPAHRVFVADTLENSPARHAGLLRGDEIISVNFQKVFSAQHFISLIQSSAGAQVTIEILRDEIPMTFAMIPKLVETGDYMIGASLSPPGLTIVHIPPFELVINSLLMIKKTFAALFNPKSNVKAEHLSGPVGIIQNQALLARQDFRLLLWFVVILNINLAVLNLLPIPVLDGGHITLSLIEMIARRPVPVRLVESLQTVFALLLIGFFLFVTYHDTLRGVRMFQRDQEEENRAREQGSIRFDTTPTPAPAD